MRPRRRREVQIAALDHLWALKRPPDGSRLAKFQKAFDLVAAFSAQIDIPDEVFDPWADALRFMVDDRDDDMPWGEA